MFGAGLAMTSGSLLLLHAVASAPHPAVEVLVLTAANLLVTLMRFVAMRVWIFRCPRVAAMSVDEVEVAVGG